MAFHEVRLPTHVSRGARGGPERRVQIVELSSGFEERNARWSKSRRRYDIGYGIRTADDLAEVIAFWEARAGPLHGFRFKDWSDFKSCAPSGNPSATDQVIGAGDNTEDTFQLVKTYVSSSQSYEREIKKVVSSTVLISFDSVPQPSGWTVDDDTGLVTFTSPPGTGVIIRAGFEFDTPVRFENNQIDTTLDWEQVGSIPSIPLVELRL
jgi:uncharacterized protein (TIGR02217 family)